MAAGQHRGVERLANAFKRQKDSFEQEVQVWEKGRQ
jgi:glutamine amidotransferase PdxT